MSRYDIFPNRIEREIMRKLLMGEASSRFHQSRVSLQAYTDGSVVLLQDGALPIAIMKPDGTLVTAVAFSTKPGEYYKPALCFIFAELGVSGRFPPTKLSYTICGPLTTMAYRASQREKATNDPA